MFVCGCFFSIVVDFSFLFVGSVYDCIIYLFSTFNFSKYSASVHSSQTFQCLKTKKECISGYLLLHIGLVCVSGLKPAQYCKQNANHYLRPVRLGENENARLHQMLSKHFTVDTSHLQKSIFFSLYRQQK